MSQIDIVIVNWNSGELLANCLESIRRHGVAEVARVIVVDNASSDASVAGVVDLFDLPIEIIKNNENQGFARACNKGASLGKAPYILFLNPDTVLFKETLSNAIIFMEQESNQQVGICGVQLVNEIGEVSRTCARFPTPGIFYSKMFGLNRLFPTLFPSHHMTEWDHMNSQSVDHVMGAFFLVRRYLFETINGFDERFFVYLEDVDLSLRAHQAGWRSYYLADTQAYHKGGGTSEQVKATRMFYSLRSRILYGYKHFSWCSATALMMGTLILEPVARCALAIFNKSYLQVKETFHGYSMLWRALPRLLFFILNGSRQ